jgi:large subunit ribosomal protein L4
MSYTIAVYDRTGSKVSDHALDADLYSDDVVNTDLIHEFVLLQQSNARVAIAHTKTRGEVAGSGKKLYRQKGTGNARVGDKKSPIRVGGGVAFGPRKERNFSKKMPKNMRRKALRGIVTLKAQEKSLMGLSAFDVTAPKTKDALALLAALELTNKKILLVKNSYDEVLEKSFANIPAVKQIQVQYLNPIDLMQAHAVIFMGDALPYLNDVN